MKSGSESDSRGHVARHPPTVVLLPETRRGALDHTFHPSGSGRPGQTIMPQCGECQAKRRKGRERFVDDGSKFIARRAAR